MLAAIRQWLGAVAELFFLQGPIAGAVILGLAAVDPHPAGLAAVAVVAALAMARGITGGWDAGRTGSVAHNAVLVGLAVGHGLAWSWPALGMAVLLGALTAAASLVLSAECHRLLGLPVLSLPFVLISWLLLILGCASTLEPAIAGRSLWASAGIALPAWPEGFLRSLGAILFCDDVVSGSILAGLIAWRSRILLLSGMLGHAVGCVVRWSLGAEWSVACASHDGFNSTLSAMAVGAVLLVPGRGAVLAGMIAAAVAALLGQAGAVLLANQSLPVLTVPFVLATWLSLRCAMLWRPAALPIAAIGTPESTLLHHRSLDQRVERTGWDIALPCAGRWVIWQGVDGAWTHQGPWRHALDLVMRGADGRTWSGEAADVRDFHAWMQPVLSPVRGLVVAVVDGIPDNPIGCADAANNWGNLVIVRDPRGFCVELSHLACGSLTVAIGQWVECGALLGRCGNSGYSTEPHLHVQVQTGERIGDPTVPFQIVHYRDQHGFHLHGVPQAGDVVEAIPADARLARAMDPVPGQAWRFRDAFGEELVWRIERDADGGVLVRSGRGRLHLGRQAASWRCWMVEGDDPWMHRLQLALPSLPLCALDGLAWHDHLPVSTSLSWWRTQLVALAGLISDDLGTVRVDLIARGGRVDAVIPRGWGHDERHLSCHIDPDAGLLAICEGPARLERIFTHPEPAAQHAATALHGAAVCA